MEDKATASQLIDSIIQSLGVWGRYQIVQIVVIFLTSWPASNQLFSIIYIGYQPPLRCHDPANISLSLNISGERPYYDTCKELFENINTTSCPFGYDYDNPKDASFTSEWDLVCDQSYQAQLAQTILVVGQAVGAIFFTFIADKYGRLKSSVLSQWCMLAVSIGTIFAPNPTIYTVTKFFTGFAQQGHVMAARVMSIELLPTSHRTIPHAFGIVIWSVFLCIQVGFAYFLRDISWRYLQGVTTATSIISLIPSMLILDETIRWLFANERIDQLKKILAKAAVWNNADRVLVKQKVDTYLEEMGRELRTIDTTKSSDTERVKDDQETKPRVTFLDIMKNKRLRVTTFIMFFAWIVNSLTAFGLSLTVSKLSGNRFLNYFLINIVSIPASLVSYYTLVRWGRKKTCMVFHAMAGVFLISAVLLGTFLGDSASGAVVALTILGKFAISASWNTLFLYTPELYPTNVRSLGLGICSSSSRIGGMLAPFSNLVIDYIPWLPGTIYGCSCIIVCFLVIFLPETLNRELPQTLGEMKAWNEKLSTETDNDSEIKHCNIYTGPVKF